MSLKPVERARSSFSLRLNLWYAAFFVFACFGLFLIAYFVLATSIQQREREILSARLEEYRAWYAAGGIKGLKWNFYNSRPNDKNAFLVRVEGFGDNAFFLSTPPRLAGF